MYIYKDLKWAHLLQSSCHSTSHKNNFSSNVSQLHHQSTERKETACTSTIIWFTKPVKDNAFQQLHTCMFVQEICHAKLRLNLHQFLSKFWNLNGIWIFEVATHRKENFNCEQALKPTRFEILRVKVRFKIWSVVDPLHMYAIQHIKIIVL